MCRRLRFPRTVTGKVCAISFAICIGLVLLLAIAIGLIVLGCAGQAMCDGKGVPGATALAIMAGSSFGGLAFVGPILLIVGCVSAATCIVHRRW